MDILAALILPFAFAAVLGFTPTDWQMWAIVILAILENLAGLAWCEPREGKKKEG